MKDTQFKTEAWGEYTILKDRRLFTVRSFASREICSLGQFSVQPQSLECDRKP